jgi:predicted DNA-binding protein
VAEAAGADVAPRLRHMLRAITAGDFPASWHTGDAPRRGTTGGRSHDSRAYGQRFMLRLDAPTRGTLENLSKHFNKSSAEIIRQLVAQATPEAFPTSWRLAAAAHRLQDAGPADRGTP